MLEDMIPSKILEDDRTTDALSSDTQFVCANCVFLHLTKQVVFSMEVSMNKLRVISFLLVLFVIMLPTSVSFSQDLELILESSLGNIAYINGDFDVWTLDLETEEQHQVTTDASTIRRYQWPTWSRDGRLAYFCCDVQYSSVFDVEVFISDDGKTSGESVYNGTRQSITYAYWSPEGCRENENCLDLAILLSNVATNSFIVELIRDGESPSNETIAFGAPFYYSWNPSGTRIVTHRNQRRIEIYDVETGDFVETLSTTPGAFQAPAWSPVDDRILFGERGENRSMTDLKINANGVTQTIAEDLEGQVSFIWSPDGNYIAYRVVSESDIDSLFVVDAITGEVVSRSSVMGVLAFFWSPDSTKLAYITLSTPPGTFNAGIDKSHILASYAQNISGLAWSVLDVNTGANERYSAFVPTEEMLYVLLYFDQFAQSHQVWSPDSSHLVYSEMADASQPIISILDVSQPDTVPITIANGVYAVWSYK